MNIIKAQAMQVAIEQFFYKVRYNITLHNALKSKTYAKFRDALEEALTKQILYYAKFEKVNDIIGKATRTLDDQLLLITLSNMWIPLYDLLPETLVDEFMIFAADVGGKSALSKLKINARFSLTDEQYIALLLSKKTSLFELIDNSTKSWITRTIEEGVNREMSLIDIAKSLRDEAHKTALYRSDTIAEHELHKIMNQVAQEIYRRAEITDQRWVTSHDERVCEICVANEDGGVIKIGGIFPDGSEAPPAHLHCRCILLPIYTTAENIWTGNQETS